MYSNSHIRPEALFIGGPCQQAPWALQLGIDIRAGIHTGEIEQRGGDVAGIAVNIAARVASRAEPGQVLVSRTVVDLTAGSGIGFVDRGEHDLKGVPQAWRLYAVEG